MTSQRQKNEVQNQLEEDLIKFKDTDDLNRENKSKIQAFEQISQLKNKDFEDNQSDLLLGKFQDKIHFRKTKARWVILLLIAYFFMSSYFMLYLPNVLQTAMLNILNINQEQYNYANAMYSIPNIIAPLFVSYIVNNIGMNFTQFTYTLLMVVGVGTQFLSGVYKEFYLLLIGIIVYGIGINGSIVVFNSFICIWFKGKELSTALSVVVAFQFFGLTMCAIIIPPIQQKYQNLEAPLYAAFIIILTCMVSLIFIILLDRYADYYDRKHELVQISSVIKEEFVNVQEAKHFGKLFWLVTTGTLLGYGCLQYTNNLQQQLLVLYDLDSVVAARWMAMQYIIMLPCTPLLGYFTDKRGKRAYIFIFGSVINILQFLLFIITPDCPQGQCSSLHYIIPLALGGIGNSFFGAVNSPMVALSVKPKYLNTAFGIYDAMMQVGMSLTPFLMGFLLDLKNTPKFGFQYYFFFCLFIAILQLVDAIMIYMYDQKNGKILDIKQKYSMFLSIGVAKAKQSKYLTQLDTDNMVKNSQAN